MKIAMLKYQQRRQTSINKYAERTAGGGGAGRRGEDPAYPCKISHNRFTVSLIPEAAQRPGTCSGVHYFLLKILYT